MNFKYRLFALSALGIALLAPLTSQAFQNYKNEISTIFIKNNFKSGQASIWVNDYFIGWINAGQVVKLDKNGFVAYDRIPQYNKAIAGSRLGSVEAAKHVVGAWAGSINPVEVKICSVSTKESYKGEIQLKDEASKIWFGSNDSSNQELTDSDLGSVSDPELPRVGQTADFNDCINKPKPVADNKPTSKYTRSTSKVGMKSSPLVPIQPYERRMVIASSVKLDLTNTKWYIPQDNLDGYYHCQSRGGCILSFTDLNYYLSIPGSGGGGLMDISPDSGTYAIKGNTVIFYSGNNGSYQASISQDKIVGNVFSGTKQK